MSGFKLDWQHWLYGLFAGLIGGGAGGVVTALTGAIKLPDVVNLNTGLHNFVALFYISFVIHAMISGAFYLQKSPLPTIEDSVTTAVSTTKQPGAPPKTTETIVETHTETK